MKNLFKHTIILSSGCYDFSYFIIVLFLLADYVFAVIHLRVSNLITNLPKPYVILVVVLCIVFPNSKKYN